MNKLWKICVTTTALLSLLAFNAEAAPLSQKAIDAAKTALEGWELDYADQPDPKVDTGESVKGFRVIFTKRYDEDVEKGISGTTKPRFNHVDLVLVPQQTKGFDQIEARSAIQWSQMPEEYFTTPRWIGTGFGYEWFCRSNIPTMDDLKAKLKLSGGESHIAILCSGLPAEDRNFLTAKYATGKLKSAGSAAIPDIVSAISGMSSAGKIPRAPMYALKLLDCPEAENALVAYSTSADKNIAIAAGDALCIPPFIEKAQNVYLKMLKEKRNIAPSAEACKNFSLVPDAAKAIDAIIDSPGNLFDFRDAILARSLYRNGKYDQTPFETASKITTSAMHSGDVEGTPKTFVIGQDEKVTKAKLLESDMKRLKPLEEELAATQDKDLAFIAALWLCMFNAPDAAPEFSARVRESGARVLRLLPRQNVEPYLAKLSRKLQNKEEAEAIQRIFRKCASLSLAPDLPTDSKATKQPQQR